jgi:hypothetical protein
LTRLWTIVGIRTRRGGGIIFLPIALILTFWLVEQLRIREVPLWVDVGHSLEYSLLILGPLVASATAFQAVQEERGALRELLDSMPRVGYLRDLALVSGELVWSVIAYLILSLWLVLVTAFGATAGSPDLELLLAGLAGIGTFASLGFLTGRIIPRYFAPPLVAVATYLIIAATGSGGTALRLLSPLIDGEPTPLLPFPARVGVFQSLWFASLAVALFGAAVLWRETSRALLTVTALATIFAVLSALGLVLKTHVFVDSVGVDYGPACQTKLSLRVCIHPAFRDVLAPTADAASATLRPLTEATGWPARIQQVGTRADALEAEKQHSGTLAFTALPVGSQGFDAGTISQSVAFAVTGSETCERLDPNDPVRLGLALWLINEAEPGSIAASDFPFAAWIDSLPDGARRDWLRMNLQAIHGCDEVPLPAGL